MRYDHPPFASLAPAGVMGLNRPEWGEGCKAFYGPGPMRFPGINGFLQRTSGSPRLKRLLLIIPDPASGEGGQEYVRVFWACSISLNKPGGPGKISASLNIYGDTDQEMVMQVRVLDWLSGISGIS